MILISVFSTTCTLHILETPIREAFLKPRNFNPHPYTQKFHNHFYDIQSTIDLNDITANYIDQTAKNIETGELFPAIHPSNGIRRSVE